MSTDSEAKLFYGVVKPTIEARAYDGDYDYEAEESETEYGPWSDAHGKPYKPASVGLYGYDDDLGYFLAINDSLHTVEWSTTKLIPASSLVVQPEWDEQIRAMAEYAGLDISGLEIGWHLVCLYF